MDAPSGPAAAAAAELSAPDLVAVRDLLARPRPGRRPAARVADRGRPVEPDLRAHRRHPPVGAAPPAAGPRARHRPRHAPRVPGDARPRTHRRCRSRARFSSAPTRTCSAPRSTSWSTSTASSTGPPPTWPASTPTAPAGSATRCVDTLADLHVVDPAAVGLADFGRPEGYLDRQVRRWTAQLDASRSPRGARASTTCTPTALAGAVPATQRASIVHGDYRLDNAIVAADDPGRLSAVLDWEMATLGDPLTDLALFALYWQGWGVRDNPIAATPADPASRRPPRWSRRYAERTGLRPRRRRLVLGLRLLQARGDPARASTTATCRARPSARVSTGSARSCRRSSSAVSPRSDQCKR